MGYRIELAGQKFGKLLVLEEIMTSDKNCRRLTCLCDCGKQITAKKSYVKNGKITHCGCMRRQSYTTAYVSWKSMKRRCCGSHISYHRYGGRGIKVCERWLHSFENFIADMGERSSLAHSLDRINNDMDYCKENCRWATRREQSENRSSNKLGILNGQTKTIIEWEKELGYKRRELCRRTERQSLEYAISYPSNYSELEIQLSYNTNL